MERGRIAAQRTAESWDCGLVADWLRDGAVAGAIVSSTRGDAASVAAALRGRVPRVVAFTSATPVPIRNAYATPGTLGCDRLAAAVGAAALFPGRDVLVVDLGTAVTFDLVTADATFRGGCISPGLALRFKALHEHTARLPLCWASDGECLVGTSTRDAVTHGVVNSLTFEIEGYIARMEALYPGLCVIFTGGDANFFAKRIKNTIFANCNPVLRGLERILEYDASEEHLD